MRIRIKRVDKSIPLPEYQTPGATSMDLYAGKNVEVLPDKTAYIPLNVVMKIPDGYVGILAVRSSTHKMGLMPVNGIGIIDPDYCGDEDVWTLAVWNFTKKKVTVEKGIRIAQILILPREKADWVEVETMGERNRGGFGSTGKK